MYADGIRFPEKIKYRGKKSGGGWYAIYWYSHRERVEAIMWRISRDRYLTPDEVKEVGFKVCRKISGNFSYTYTCAIGFESENVGMFRGQPVLYRYEEGFYELSKMIMAKKNKRIMPELLVLMAITGIGDK